MKRLLPPMIATFIPVRLISPFHFAIHSLSPRVFHANWMIPSRRTFGSRWDTKIHVLEESYPDLNMENIHREWTKEEDQLLYDNRHESVAKLASMLGRGLRGIQARLEKIQDIDSFAYSRLFMNPFIKEKDSLDDVEMNKRAKKLSSASEILNRIRWDPHLNPTDFSVLYFDRLEETLLETCFDATNDSIQGREDYFVFALPEHRIMGVKYRERIVWDRNKRMDCVFGSMGGQGITIDHVVQTYDEWKRAQDEAEELRRVRQIELSTLINNILGDLAYHVLKSSSADIIHKAQSPVPIPEPMIDDYVRNSLSLFRTSIRNETLAPGNDLDTTHTRTKYLEALEAFSTLVSFMPHENLRERILVRLQLEMDKISPPRSPIKGYPENLPLPQLKEEELLEKFVKGSGAGGQKINKTSNKVILVHEPTQLRVECQETRSLQQNRKIARKKLQLKLDEYYNGSMSKTSQKIASAASKKAKVLARNRERQREREEMKNEELMNGLDEI